MALRDRDRAPKPVSAGDIPSPVEDGYDFVQSLGKMVDEVMRHSRDGSAVKALSVDSERRLEGDPEPITPPDPVPDGSDTGTRGADPEDFATR